MGGIYNTDALIAFYKTKSRCRKWTVRRIFHAVDMAITNSWLKYKRDMHALGISQKDVMDLLHFRKKIGESLVKDAAKRQNNEVRPLSEVQYDNIGHFPEHQELPLPLRCKNPGCGGKSR